MYAYCNNNPINMQDENGTSGIGLISLLLVAVVLILYTCTIIENNTDTSGGELIQDIVDSLPSISLNAKITTPTKTDITTHSQVTTNVTTTTKTNPNKQETFPVNPHEFNPKGLTKLELPGSYNGKIIKWMQGKTTIFEWNEDINNGAHYHALKIEWDNKHLGPHYAPLSPVPEPWNTIYFGG